jgi:hypothetical protein
MLFAYAGCYADFLLFGLQLFDSNQATQIAGFDNVGLAMLSVFQAMTLSNWSFSMYRYGLLPHQFGLTA